MTDYCQHGIYKDNECLACECDRYKAALEKIMAHDGPGLDGSPSGECHKIAKRALKRG